MKIIINRWIPIGRRFYAINLCGVLFAKGPCNRRIINHESIHTQQIKELLVLGFYLWYVIEWTIKLIKYRNMYKAYENISFEREAYANDANYSYISTRPRYAFMKYFHPQSKKNY